MDPQPGGTVTRTNGRGDRLLIALLIAVLLMVGPALVAGPAVRGADAGESPAPTSASPAAAAASPSAAPSGSVTLPDTPAATRLQWVLDALDRGADPLAVAEISDAFSPTFLAQVTTDQLTQVFAQISAAGPFTVTSYTPSADGLQAEARLDGPGVVLSVGIAVEQVAPHLIVGLGFAPASASPTIAPIATWEAVDVALRGLVPQPSVLAAEIVDGRCVPIHALDAERSLAIGSTFKLYVLGELARQVAEGTATWDEKLAIRDDWKSLPSGRMQDDPAGTRHTLEAFATGMISISDNTAADHLIHRLGREHVEANLSAMGHADPSLMTPFITARDLFVLKATGNAALTSEYLASDPLGRRTLLDGRVASTLIALTDLGDWIMPRDIDTLEWFASTKDLCAAMAKLRAFGTQPGLAPVLEILAVNPGMPFDPARWPYVGFKGGSEPGVLQLTWLVRRDDDRWFVLSITVDDPADATDRTMPTVEIAREAFDLLAEAP